MSMRKLQNSSEATKSGVDELVVVSLMVGVHAAAPSQQPSLRVRSDSKSREVPRGMMPEICRYGTH